MRSNNITRGFHKPIKILSKGNTSQFYKKKPKNYCYNPMVFWTTHNTEI